MQSCLRREFGKCCVRDAMSCLKYGYGIVIPPCNPRFDPVLVFDETDIECNVWRFVVYILWLKKHPCSFDKYRLVKAERPQSWKKSLVKLATL